MLMIKGLVLWLESIAALVLLPFVFAPVTARILIEEKTLRRILPGYPEYLGAVRTRLIPGIW